MEGSSTGKTGSPSLRLLPTGRKMHLNDREGPMLTPMFNRRQQRNPYFHFHPMHTTYSLLAVIVLMGMLAWFLSRMNW